MGKDVATDDDSGLLRRARIGDRSAFEAIVRTHQSAALRLAAAVGGDATEAGDIVQEAFVRAYGQLHTVRDGDALRPWLLRIVANQAKNSRRSRWRREARTQRQAALRISEPTGPDEVALGGIEARVLLHAVTSLPEIDRTIIGCRYFAGLTEAETAATLGIAAGTVKSRTARALGRLRTRLDEEGGS
ncbi:MAG: sigma-70 family RNA polymerase sigma factor [Ilumatobacteraceae bacterium]